MYSCGIGILGKECKVDICKVTNVLVNIFSEIGILIFMVMTLG